MANYIETLLSNVEYDKEYMISNMTINEISKQRLYDFGVIIGAKIIPLFCNILNDSKAYKINESVIAIRNSDAKNIFVI